MAKRDFTVGGVEHPAPKRAKTGRQTRLDTFFSQPTKSRATQLTSNPFAEGQSINHDKRDAPPHPFVIDVDAEEADAEAAQVMKPTTALEKGKGVLGYTSSVETKTLQFTTLDVDPVYYHAEEQPWLEEGAPYAFLAYALSTLSQTRSRIAILNILTNCLCTIIIKHTGSLLPSLYLLSNTLAPPYVNIELGLGPSIISRSIQNVSGITSASLRRLYNTLGDPGDVVVSAKSNLRTLIPHSPLTISYVYDSLLQIAHSKGQGAAKRKERIIEKLLLSANGEEIRFLTRTLCQNIRVGAVRTTILTALARATVLSHASTDIPGDICVLRVSSTLLSEIRKSPLGAKKTTDPARTQLNEVFSRADRLIRGVFVRHPNYDDIVSAILEAGIPGLEARVPLAIGIPLHPTLGSPVHSLAEAYERLGEKPFVAEFKYDGQRAQVHAIVENGQMIDFKLFSRHLEDMTSKYPDIRILVQTLLKQTPTVTSFIMDAEIVAIDPRSGVIKTFQELSNRAKKDVDLKNIQVSVCLYGFDLMYLNGEALLQKTFRERRSLLGSLFAPYIPKEIGHARFAHVENMNSEMGEASVEGFWQRSVQSQCEGLMIKLLDNDTVHDEGNDKDNSRKKPLPATYEPDKRTTAWLKLKKDYVTGIGDSLDLVPIGAWHGNGRKVKWWSPILMGLYDHNNGRYVAVCKCMSGFTDKFYQDLRVRYSPSPEGSTCSTRPLWECDFGGFKPDVYFRPQEVWEIRGADITLSPVSVAAKNLVSSPRGLSIRFPRFIKIREDKSIEQASTAEFLTSIWGKQQGNRREDEDDLIDVDFHSSSAASEGDLSEDGL